MPPTSTPPDEIPVTVLQHDQERKQKMKSYADSHNRASMSEIRKGDTVLLRQPKQTKLSTTYDPKPYTVEEKKGPSVLLKRSFEPQILRNESMVRKIPRSEDVTNNKKKTPEHSAQQFNVERKHEKQIEGRIRSKRVRRPPDYYGQS